MADGSHGLRVIDVTTPSFPTEVGYTSIPGAAVGGLFLGLVESFATGYVSSDYEDVFAFALLVAVLIFRPEGILGRSTTQKGTLTFSF